MSNEEQIRYLGDVQRLVLNPGEIVVLKAREHISAQTEDRLRHYASQVLPGHRILILSGGMDIGVLAAGSKAE